MFLDVFLVKCGVIAASPGVYCIVYYAKLDINYRRIIQKQVFIVADSMISKLCLELLVASLRLKAFTSSWCGCNTYVCMYEWIELNWIELNWIEWMNEWTNEWWDVLIWGRGGDWHRFNHERGRQKAAEGLTGHTLLSAAVVCLVGSCSFDSFDSFDRTSRCHGRSECAGHRPCSAWVRSSLRRLDLAVLSVRSRPRSKTEGPVWPSNIM